MRALGPFSPIISTVCGESLMTIGVVHIAEGESSLIKVTVPESGVSEGLALGAPVSLPGLVARPWESVFDGQQAMPVHATTAPAAVSTTPVVTSRVLISIVRWDRW